MSEKSVCAGEVRVKRKTRRRGGGSVKYSSGVVVLSSWSAARIQWSEQRFVIHFPDFPLRFPVRETGRRPPLLHHRFTHCTFL